MGWLHNLSGKTLKETIDDYTQETEKRRLLKKCFRGNPSFSGALWTVWELECNDGVMRRIIGCDLMQYWRTRSGDGWAVKSMDELDGPCRYHCPLSYLQIAKSFENEDFSKNWREGVRAYHAKKKKGAA